jgi:hypothetical protein
MNHPTRARHELVTTITISHTRAEGTLVSGTAANKLIDLTGQTFGIWKVIEKAPRRDNKTRWLCECMTCGAQCSLRRTV